MGCMNRNLPGLCLALSAAGAFAGGLATAEPAKVPPEAFAPAALAAPPPPAKLAPRAPAQPEAKAAARPAAPPAAKPAVTSVAKSAVTTPGNVSLAPLPRKRPAGAAAYAQPNVGLRGSLFATRARFQPIVRPVSGPFAVATTTTTSPADIDQLK